MKLVRVILRPETAVKLRDILLSIGCHGITVKESQGFGEYRKDIKPLSEVKPYEAVTDYTSRKEIEFVVSDDRLKEVLQTIKENARTSQDGDGRVYVMPIEDSFHIHKSVKHTGNYDEENWD